MATSQPKQQSRTFCYLPVHTLPLYTLFIYLFYLFNLPLVSGGNIVHVHFGRKKYQWTHNQKLRRSVNTDSLWLVCHKIIWNIISWLDGYIRCLLWHCIDNINYCNVIGQLSYWSYCGSCNLSFDRFDFKAAFSIHVSPLWHRKSCTVSLFIGQASHPLAFSSLSCSLCTRVRFREQVLRQLNV